MISSKYIEVNHVCGVLNLKIIQTDNWEVEPMLKLAEILREIDPSANKDSIVEKKLD